MGENKSDILKNDAVKFGQRKTFVNDSQSDFPENRAGKSEKALLNAVLILVSFTKRCCAEDDGQPASGEKVMIVEIISNILSCIFQIYARGTTRVVV